MLWQEFVGNYNGFLIIVRSNFGKEFAFYIPHKIKEVKNCKITNEQYGFYWINGDQLETVKKSGNSYF